MSTRIIALVGFALLALLGGFAVDAATVDSSTERSIDNEQFTVDKGNWTALNYSNIDGARYPHVVTVYNSDGKAVERGADYQWNASTGEIKPTSDGDLPDGSTATVDYSYSFPSQTQSGVNSLWMNLLSGTKGIILMLGVGIVLMGMTVLSRVS